MTEQPESSHEPELRIANEFAEAVVRRVAHGNGTRLHVVAPRSGAECMIDAVVLEALAAVPPDELTAILVGTVPGNDGPTQKSG